jgi:hypothetical protein
LPKFHAEKVSAKLNNAVPILSPNYAVMAAMAFLFNPVLIRSRAIKNSEIQQCT